MKNCKDCARYDKCLRTGNLVGNVRGERTCDAFTQSVKSQKPEFQKEMLFVKAVCEGSSSIIEGLPDITWNIPFVMDCRTNKSHSVFDWSICKRTGITDKDGVPLYEYDLLELTKFGSKPSYGFIVWSDFYRRYVIKRSLEYSGHCNIEDFTIKVVGNVILNSRDQEAIVKQDDAEKDRAVCIDNSYCPSQFKK